MALAKAAPLELSDAERRQRFRAVFAREFDYVWASLRRLGVHPRDLDDVAQDVFVRVFRRIDECDPQRPIRPWLFAFAFRIASDWRRLARHRVEVLGVDGEAAAPQGCADELLARAEEVELVLRALDAIEIGRRAVFILYELDGCPMKDIAASLGIPLFTGYSRLRLARKEFTTAVRRLRPKEGQDE
jgi:RNA polymerase sigma-70 factor (ECF subfamily)